jgi:hypothetical protein
MADPSTVEARPRSARPPRILDVVAAVKSLAQAHPEISAWWYAPALRLRLAGELPVGVEPTRVEVVAEARPDADPDYACLGRELATRLDADAIVRAHRGAREERHLFRVASVGR